MLKMLIFNVLVLLQCLCVKAQIDYDRNSIYQTNKVTSGSFAPTEQSSQQDVLKELGVDLSNEGKPPTTYARGRRRIDYIFCGADLKKV